MWAGAEEIDESPEYTIILPEERLDELRSILLDFKVRARQEGIYFDDGRHTEVSLV